MQFGTSFSHLHLKWLKLDPLKAIREFNRLNFAWIRLGCYWNEIEKQKGKYNFSDLDKLVRICNKNKINIILTVGMKAPRWPEYHLPNWLSEKLIFKKYSKINTSNKILLEATCHMIKKAVLHYQDSPAIKVWQVENEPLDPSGSNYLRIDKNFLKEEVCLVKQLDPNRKILINFWANELAKRKHYRKVLDLADIIGLDLYLKHELSVAGKFIKYLGPIDSKKKLVKISEKIQKSGKRLWITELQAEPWEPNNTLSNSLNPPSFSPADFKKNFKYVHKLNPEVVLFWGFEFWCQRKIQGDKRYWEKAKRLINPSSHK